jgi:A/G-specific adenine glycosylase
MGGYEARQPLLPPAVHEPLSWAGTTVSDAAIARFRDLIKVYYATYGRDFSWRRDITPYRVLVSEIMLQQTQTSRVDEKFPAFIDRFGDFQELAEAPLSEVLRMWKGLGYNRRARFLHESAQRIVAEHGGVLPDDEKTLATLPGIGGATASSICAFAFNQPVVFIETNIRTVFLYFFFNAQSRVHDRDILPLVTRALDRTAPRAWYSALMDYGVFLKKTVGNVSRASRHYTRQSPFAGSNRQLRGRILQLLLDNRRLERGSLAGLLDEDAARVDTIIDALIAESMLVEQDNFLRLP